MNILTANRFNYKLAMPTPWGKADHKRRLMAGVYDIGTPSHGGIMIGKAVARKILSPGAIACGMEWNQWLCFEEDCNASAVMYEKPELFLAERPSLTAEQLRESCRKSLERWNPEYFTINNKGVTL